MNKAQLITSIAAKSELTKKDSEKALNAFIETVQEALANDEKIPMIGFGTFETVDRAERKGRNPKTLEEITIPACRGIKFKAGKDFKDRVNK